LNDYRNFDLPFVHRIKSETELELSDLYYSIDKSNNDIDWRMLSKKVSVLDFLNNAPQSVVDAEFAKWEEDDSAWNRVILLDSISLSPIYLERFPSGNHEYSARKIILDDAYSKCGGHDRKITSNYCGNTTISINNSSLKFMRIRQNPEHRKTTG